MLRSTRKIGQTIRELRKNKNITGAELGGLANLSQSKISKIETGFYSSLQYDEIQTLLNILDAPSTIRQQILHTIDEDAANNTYRISAYNFRVSFASTELENNSRHIKIYTSDAVPAMLQTVSYRKGSLRYKGVEESMLSSCVKDLLRRQDLLFDEKHNFHLIIPQNALYTLATPPKEHLVQLDRLERISLMADHGVRLGIIPLEAGTVLIEHSSFALYDDRTLIQALARSEVATTNKQDIELHIEIFEALGRLAYYGEDAVGLIRQAIDYFA